MVACESTRAARNVTNHSHSVLQRAQSIYRPERAATRTPWTPIQPQNTTKTTSAALHTVSCTMHAHREISIGGKLSRLNPTTNVVAVPAQPADDSLLWSQAAFHPPHPLRYTVCYSHSKPSPKNCPRPTQCRNDKTWCPVPAQIPVPDLPAHPPTVPAPSDA